MASLAGGMADDFNNILTTVMGACSLIDRDDPANGELLEYVALIRASAEHAAQLSDRLMHTGAKVPEKIHRSKSQDSVSAGTSLRDKKAENDIVSTTKNPGGTPS